MQFFTHETLTGSVALKTTRELRIICHNIAILQRNNERCFKIE